MDSYDADLHIHSPHSIAVSKNLNLDTMVKTCKKKGLMILGTGDITQPDWRRYLEANLIFKNGVYSYKDVYFIIQTELEDEESIHHVVLLPDIKAGEELQKRLEPKTKDIKAYYAGRPHIHLSPAEIVDLVDEVGGISGPAHAFTPFKAIFRQGKYSSLEDCYGDAYKKVYFLELGLSADTYIADRMACLKDVTFLSNSDAHSEGVQSLGREFNSFYIESPNFEEVLDAILRKNGRKIILNVGLEPRLGKYPMMFCKTCRSRVRLFLEDNLPDDIQKMPRQNGLVESYTIDDNFINFIFRNKTDLERFRGQIEAGRVRCPKCMAKNKNGKIFLGVFDRINEIADYETPQHPEHRPPYFDVIPLVEIIKVLKGVKSTTAKSVLKEYDLLINKYGNEFKILTDDDTLQNMRKDGYTKLAQLILAFRNKEIEFIPGGGGKYGEIKLDSL
ncbi:MAG: endonuclease Q family protein [Promethearchaeota archaeon]